jgi:hypothetical protein
MVEKRIVFAQDFQKVLFKMVCKDLGIRLKDLSKILSVNYWTLKKWGAGNYTIPKRVVSKLLALCSKDLRKKILKNIKEERDSNWGQIKGAKVALSKYTAEELKKRMLHVRSFKRKRSTKVVKDEDFWELVGILMGDGCLSEFFSNYEKRERCEVVIVGNEKWDLEYYQNHVLPLVRKVLGVNPKIRRKRRENVIAIHIRNKQVFEIFRNVGLPVGKKTQKLQFTTEMLNLPVRKKIRIIRGLWDTDGTLFARRDEGYKYPYVSITTASDKLRQQLKQILREFGFPAYIHEKNVVIRGARNVKKWFREIGTSHPVKRARFEHWLTTGKLLPKSAEKIII